MQPKVHVGETQDRADEQTGQHGAQGEADGCECGVLAALELGYSVFAKGLPAMRANMVGTTCVVVFGALHLGQLNWGVDKPVRICQARNVKVIVEKGFPMHVDGEPWEQPACTIDIKLRNKALMLRRTADARGLSIVKMNDALEWAHAQGVITQEQRDEVMAEAYRRAEKDRINSMAHQRTSSLGNLVGRHRRARSGGGSDGSGDFY